MNRNDVIQVDRLKEELSSAFRSFEQSMRSVFGELVYGIDTVVERYNDLNAKHTALETRHDALEARMEVLTTRLIALERGDGNTH